MKNFALVSVGIALAAAGCQQSAPAPKKTGSYAAARHSMTGSNIPQPYSATNVGDTVDPDQFSNTQNQQMNLTDRSLSGGVGGR